MDVYTKKKSYLYTNDNNTYPSIEAFYGPWTQEEFGDEGSILNSTIKSIIGKEVPEGATAAIWNEDQTVLTEKWYIGGIWIDKSSGSGSSTYLRQVFAFYNLPNANIPPKPTCTSPANLDANWVLSIPEKYAQDALTTEDADDFSQLWVSFATFIVKNNTYTPVNANGTTLGDDEDIWSDPVLVGGGSTTSTTPSYSDRYVCDIDNDCVVIPTDLDYYTTNSALKIASLTTLRMYYLGSQISNFNTITIAGLSTSANTDFSASGLKIYLTSYLDDTSDPRITYYLGFDPDKIPSEKGQISGQVPVMFAVSVGGSAKNAFFILYLLPRAQEYGYRMQCSPNVINVTRNGVYPDLGVSVSKYSYEGVEAAEISGTDLINSVIRVKHDNTVIAETSGKSTLSVASLTLLNALSETQSGDYIKVEYFIKDANNNEVSQEYDYLPIFLQALLVGAANTKLNMDLINDHAVIGDNLLSDDPSLEIKDILATLTTATLQIQCEGETLADDKYKLVSVTSNNDKGDAEIITQDSLGNELTYPKSFKVTKITGETTFEVKFKYCDPDYCNDDDTADSDSAFLSTLIQTITVVENGADADFFSMKVMPSTVWIKKSGSTYVWANGGTLDLYFNHIKGTTSTLINYNTSDTFLSDNGYKLKVDYFAGSDTAIQSDSISFSDASLSDFQYTLASIANLNTITNIDVTLLDSADNIKDIESIDVNTLPEDGSKGDSNYTLRITNPYIYLDDDSIENEISAASTNECTLYYGTEPYSGDVLFQIDLDKSILYDSNSESFSEKLSTYFDVNYSNSTVKSWLTLKSGVSIDNRYLYGNIYYNAYLSGQGDSVATATANFRVLDISDGETYNLLVTPNVLYIDNLKTFVSNKSTTIKFNAIKNVIDKSEPLTLDDTHYIALYKDTDLTTPLKTWTSGTSVTVDFNSDTYDGTNTYSSLIQKTGTDEIGSFVVQLIVNNYAIDTSTIYFSVKGDIGSTADSGFVLSIDNDNIIIDDNTNDSDLQEISKTNVSVLYDGNNASLSDFTGTPSLSCVLDTNLASVLLMSMTSAVSGISCDNYLSWVDSTLASLSAISGTITYTLSGTDSDGHAVSISKKLKIQVKDFSDGAVYQLQCSPNFIGVDSYGNVNTHKIICSVSKIKNGVASKATFNNGTSGDIVLYIYPVSGSLSSEDTIISNLNIGDNTNGLIFSPTLISVKELNNTFPSEGSGFIFDAYLIDKYNNQVLIDSEAVQYTKAGAIGNNASYYLYCFRSDDFDKTFTIETGTADYPPTGWSIARPEKEDGKNIYLASRLITFDADNLPVYSHDWEIIGLYVQPLPSNNGFKSFVFKRSSDTLSTPYGGSYEYPWPTKLNSTDDTNTNLTYPNLEASSTNVPTSDGGWTDGIPSGTDRLWMSSRIFTSDGLTPLLDFWTTPQAMADSTDMDIEYSSIEDIKDYKTLLNSSARPITEDIKTEDSKTVIWSNTADESTIWMAISYKRDNTWTDWKFSRIKGEKGNTGTSISIAGSAILIETLEADYSNLTDTSKTYIVHNTSDDTNDALCKYVDGAWVTYNGSSIETGTCYLVDGKLYVWDGDSWGGPFEFTGQAGTSQYMFVRYSSTDLSGRTDVTIDDNYLTPNKYIGIAIVSENVAPTKASSYTWFAWKGDDGYGYEYIYKTSTQAEYDKEEPFMANLTSDQGSEGHIDGFVHGEAKTYSEGYQLNDFIPDGWTDNPISIGEQEDGSIVYYQWMSYRQKIDNEWLAFSDPVLYSNYSISKPGDRGNDADTIEYIYTRTDTLGKGLADPSGEVDLTAPIQRADGATIRELSESELFVNDQFQDSNKVFWTDDPVGVDSDMLYEYQSHRTITYIGNTVSSRSQFSTPILWAAYGLKGDDGLSCQYVFHAFNTRYNTSDASTVATMIDATDFIGEGTERYPKCPIIGDYWTDDPEEPSFEYPYIYVSVGRRNPNSNTNQWTFSTPTLWNEYTTTTKVEDYYIATNTLDIPAYDSTDLSNDWTTDYKTALAALSSSNQYLWNCEKYLIGNLISYTNPTIIYRYASDGRGIDRIIEYYAATASTNTPTTAEWVNMSLSASIMPVVTTNCPYLWNYEEIIYTDGTIDSTPPAIIGKMGESPYTASLSNDSVILDDNCCDDETTKDSILKAASYTTVNFYHGSELLAAGNYRVTASHVSTNGKSVSTQLFTFVRDTTDTSNYSGYLTWTDGSSVGNVNDYYTIKYTISVANTEFATAYQTIKVADVSEDGSSYRLIVSPDVLYRTSDGQMMTSDLNNKISVSLSKCTGADPELLDLSDSSISINIVPNYINNYTGTKVENITTVSPPKGGTALTYNFDDYITNDILSFSVSAKINNIEVDNETILFSTQGALGNEGNSGFTITLDNDTIIFDDNATSDTINKISQTTISVYTKDIQLTFGTDFTITNITFVANLFNREFNLYSSNKVLATASEGLSSDYYKLSLTRTNATCNLNAVYSDTLTDNIISWPVGNAVINYEILINATTTTGLSSPITVNKRLSLKISDISKNGESYVLHVTPNEIPVRYNSETKALELGVDSVTITGSKIYTNANGLLSEDIIFDGDDNYIKMYTYYGGTKHAYMGVAGESDDYTQQKDFNYSDTATSLTADVAYATMIEYFYLEMYVDGLLVDTEDLNYVIDGADGSDGDAGLTGATIRVFYASAGHPKKDQEYYNDNSLLVRTGTENAGTSNERAVYETNKTVSLSNQTNKKDRFVDYIVYYDENDNTYSAIRPTTPDWSYSKDISWDKESLLNIKINVDNNEQSRWEEVTSYSDGIFDNLLVISGYIQKLSTTSISLQDLSGNNTGLISGEKTDTPVYIGGDSPSTSAFSINSSGDITTTGNLKITNGDNYVSFGNIGDSGVGFLVHWNNCNYTLNLTNLTLLDTTTESKTIWFYPVLSYTSYSNGDPYIINEISSSQQSFTFKIITDTNGITTIELVTQMDNFPYDYGVVFVDTNLWETNDADSSKGYDCYPSALVVLGKSTLRQLYCTSDSTDTISDDNLTINYNNIVNAENNRLIYYLSLGNACGSNWTSGFDLKIGLCNTGNYVLNVKPRSFIRVGFLYRFKDTGDSPIYYPYSSILLCSRHYFVYDYRKYSSFATVSINNPHDYYNGANDKLYIDS